MIHTSYGDIPPNVLDLEISTIDENYTSVKEMINEEVDEPIIASSYTLEVDFKDDTIIRGLTLWSEDSIYIMVYAMIGYCFVKERRNP